MNATHIANAIDAITALDLGPVKTKLMHVASGEGWSAVHADSVEAEYRRFLTLMKLYPNEATAPLVDVDTFWHYHILDTARYAADCAAAFGYFLHHDPYLGLDGDEDDTVRTDAGARMQALYLATFGTPMTEATAAWCGASTAQPAAQATAWCGATTAASKQVVWCGATTAASKQVAWCGATTAASKQVAWCGAATAASKQVAWCGATTAASKQVAWCGAATATSKQVAWCGAATAASKQVAWCGATTAASKQVAWCGATTAASKQVAWCGATTAAPKQQLAWCGASAPTAIQVDANIVLTVEHAA